MMKYKQFRITNEIAASTCIYVYTIPFSRICISYTLVKILHRGFPLLQEHEDSYWFSVCHLSGFLLSYW